MDTMSNHVQNILTKICQNCGTQLFGHPPNHDFLQDSCFAQMGYLLIPKLGSKAWIVGSEPKIDLIHISAVFGCMYSLLTLPNNRTDICSSYRNIEAF